MIGQTHTFEGMAGKRKPRPPGVLMVTGAYYPELFGAGLQCRELVRAIRGEARIAILTTTTDRRLPAEEILDGVPVYRVRVDPSRFWSKLPAGVRMAWIIVRERRWASILHLHGFSQKSILVILLGTLLQSRIAIKLTSVGHDDPESMKRRGALAYWCYSRARVYFGVSPRLAAIYTRSGLPEKRFRLIPNGVDVERFKPAGVEERRTIRREIGLPEGVTVILFVGFFSREKCPDVLFDAWARTACTEGLSSVLVLVGATRSDYYEVDRSLAADIRRRGSAAGLESRLRFIEETHEIEKLHRAADIFVLPSVREGLPNALLEAMASGTACVATQLEGVTDTLIDDGSSGILVPPRDVHALAEALVRLTTFPDVRRAMGVCARERILRDFSLPEVARDYLAAYRELGTD